MHLIYSATMIMPNVQFHYALLAIRKTSHKQQMYVRLPPSTKL